MITQAIILVLVLLVVALWLLTGPSSPFTRHAFYKVQDFAITESHDEIPLLTVHFNNSNGDPFSVRKSAEFMNDEEFILIWTAMNSKGDFPLLVHVHINLWQKWTKQIGFTVEPALVPDGVYHG